METYTPKQKEYKFKVLLGTMKNGESLYLAGFSWECDWYWGGGYLESRTISTHFNGCFLDQPDSRGHSLGSFYDPWTRLPDYLKESDVKRMSNGAAVWEDLAFFVDNAPENLNKNWWRIKDLYTQFYKLNEAAKVFQSGGHCTTNERNPAEINLDMANKINEHIETVLIPEIKKALGI